MRSVRIACFGCLLVVAAMASIGHAASQSKVTTIVAKIENENCAQRITASLQGVPNVGNVRTDVQKRIVTVAPAGAKTPSPRGLWEAVERTGHPVSRLQGPQGNFTAKPEF